MCKFTIAIITFSSAKLCEEWFLSDYPIVGSTKRQTVGRIDRRTVEVSDYSYDSLQNYVNKPITMYIMPNYC